jgi:hypothetical protein
MLTGPRPRLPLFPLPDVVHFPRTALRLHVFEPCYRQLVRDLEGQEERLRWIGMVLLKPGPELGFGQAPEVFPEGTAGRLLEVERLPDGRSNIVLQGEFRFAIEEEIPDLLTPYRQAVVRPLEEIAVDELDPGVLAVRGEILEVAEVLNREMGKRFPFEREHLAALGHEASFEALVNGFAAELDLPARRKLDLLEQALPDRAVEVLRILRSRHRVLDLLRPYRFLAEAAERN